jgi:lysophospholipase L1-like esterase
MTATVDRDVTGQGPDGELTVLCFGDSNTWGFVPGGGGERFPRSVRWPGVLEATLGRGYRVIEEGLNGRTTVLENPLTPYRNGREYLIPCLDSHKPLDLAVIFLGTNDLADRYSLPPLDIARAAASLVQIVRGSQTGPRLSAPSTLLVDLPRLGRIDALADTMSGAPERSRELPRCFRTAAAEIDAPLLALSELVSYSDVDGIHLDAQGHRAVGLAVAKAVTGILG